MGVENLSVFKPWMRSDTQEWIVQMENRIADMRYYLDEASKWLMFHGYNRSDIMIACFTMTCVWVASMRNEQITNTEIMDLIGASSYDLDLGNQIFELSPRYKLWDIEEIWHHVVRQYDDPDYHPQKAE